MSLSTIFLVLAWIAIVVLAFGYAGLLSAVRQNVAGSGIAGAEAAVELPRSLRGGDWPALVLLVDDSCTGCFDAFDNLVQANRTEPSLQLAVLASSPRGPWRNATDIKVVVDHELAESLAIAYRPALLTVGSNGRILFAQPVGNSEVLSEAITKYSDMSRVARPETGRL